MNRELPPPSAATCLAPPPLGDDAGDGTAGAPVATLARALALGRSTILIAGGRYEGATEIGGEVAIFGGLDPETGWRRVGVASVFCGGAANRVLTIAAGARVELDGIEVAPAGNAWLGIVVDNTGTVTITRCTLAGGERPAMSAALSCWGECHVESCRVASGPGDMTTAISAFGRATIVNNDLEANHIGVNCSGATIERNRIRAGMYGVYVQGDDVIVRANTITLAPPDPNARGVFVVRGARLLIEGNTIDGRPDQEQLGRWAHLPRRSWTYDHNAPRDYSELTVTENGLWFHGEADGPSASPYTGPTQAFDDFLVSDPVQPLPAELVAEVRAFLRRGGPG